MGRKRDTGLNDTLDALEKRIEQCRVLYELWFNGVEKREPIWHRQEILRQLTRLQRNSRDITNAVDRFRARNIQARFNSLTQYWNRVNLQRERGTYHKDLKRMKRRMGDVEITQGAALTENKAEHSVPRVHSLDELGDADLTQSLEEAAQQAALSEAAAAASRTAGRPPSATPRQSPQPPVTAGPSVPSTASDALSEERMQKIYRTYLKARERTQESTNVSFEAVSRSLQQQIPRLREKGYNDVDFKVVIKDGKAAIRPVAKKKED